MVDRGENSQRKRFARGNGKKERQEMKEEWNKMRRKVRAGERKRERLEGRECIKVKVIHREMVCPLGPLPVKVFFFLSSLKAWAHPKPWIYWFGSVSFKLFSQSVAGIPFTEKMPYTDSSITFLPLSECILDMFLCVCVCVCVCVGCLCVYVNSWMLAVFVFLQPWYCPCISI